jgi:hypothetical protein
MGKYLVKYVCLFQEVGGEEGGIMPSPAERRSEHHQTSAIEPNFIIKWFKNFRRRSASQEGNISFLKLVLRIVVYNGVATSRRAFNHYVLLLMSKHL